MSDHAPYADEALRFPIGRFARPAGPLVGAALDARFASIPPTHLTAWRARHQEQTR